MKITQQSKTIVKRAKLLNNALYYDVELWAQLGNDPHARLVSFVRKEDTIHFVSMNGIHDQMPINDFSIALWNVPILADCEVSEEQEQEILITILKTGTSYGTVRFDQLPGSEKSGQETAPFNKIS